MFWTKWLQEYWVYILLSVNIAFLGIEELNEYLLHAMAFRETDRHMVPVLSPSLPSNISRAAFFEKQTNKQTKNNNNNKTTTKKQQPNNNCRTNTIGRQLIVLH